MKPTAFKREESSLFNSTCDFSLFSNFFYILTTAKEQIELELTADARVSGPVWGPQKFLLSQKFRHLMG